MWQGPDLYKWIRLCIKHEIYILDDRLIRFRMHKHNISGPGNLSSVLRGSNELYQIYNLFYEITEDDFPLVFKEASQYTVNGEINIKFALSKLLLELEIPAAKTLGLNKLFELINSKESREQILRLYQYDDVSYKIDETNNSPYVLKCWSNSLSVCNAKLYYDYGDGFSEDNFSVNDVITDAAGNYYVEFTDIAPFINKKGLVGIRFDPCEFCAKIKIDGIEADGKKLDFELNKKNYGDGQYISHNGYDVFYIDDPSYIVKGVESGVSKIEVYGKLYELSIYEALDLNNRVTLAKALENFEKNQNILVRMTIKLTRAIKAVLRKPYHAIKRLFKRS